MSGGRLALSGVSLSASAGYRRCTTATPPRYLPLGYTNSGRSRAVTLARFWAASPTPRNGPFRSNLALWYIQMDLISLVGFPDRDKRYCWNLYSVVFF
jgi:hypothetical protein